MANRTTTDHIPFGKIMAFCPVHKFLRKTKGLDFCFVELRLAADDIELKTFTLKIKGKLSERG